MNVDVKNSIVLITSSDSENKQFGTGFVIRQSKGTSYVVTCAHVIRDVGGSGKVKVCDLDALVLASGESDGLDLAVLRVDGLFLDSSLELQVTANKDALITIQGFQLYAKDHLSRPLKGKLGNEVSLHSKNSSTPIPAWDLYIDEDYSLQPGYSGSPVIDQETHKVLGIVSHRQGDGRFGLAISTKALKRVWQYTDSQNLYRTLLKLGYREQVRLFRRLIDSHAVAAFLIHGFPEYGQRWLLNRLVNQYIPYSLSGKIIKLGFRRKAVRSDVSALWRDLSNRVGLRQGNYSPTDITDRIYQLWQTQNVLLVLHDVDCLPESSLRELVQKFWVPLVKKANSTSPETSKYRLVMFLLDYTGCAEKWNIPCIEHISPKPLDRFVKPPRITEFSDDDLFTWIEDQYEELPIELTRSIDITVNEILESSNNGIPELAFEEICDRCCHDWYEESEKWLKL